MSAYNWLHLISTPFVLFMLNRNIKPFIIWHIAAALCESVCSARPEKLQVCLGLIALIGSHFLSSTGDTHPLRPEIRQTVLREFFSEEIFHERPRENFLESV